MRESKQFQCFNVNEETEGDDDEKKEEEKGK
jgi:hypothetical protein